MFKPRKVVITIDKTEHDGGPPVATPVIRAGICAIMSNPYAGQYVEDIQKGMEILKPLGLDLARQLLEAMKCSAKDIQAYGKGAIVGLDGELEHGALWHMPGGYALREVLGNAKAVVPSTKKVAVAGSSIDIPLSHINAFYVRSHFNAITLQVADGPKSNELMFCLAMTTGGRIHARLGGLAAEEVMGLDGLR